MSGPEVASFLAEERTLTCATAGPRGWPHLMPLWYVLRDAPEGEPGPRLWSWTYASSQKVRNLERDPGRASRWRRASSTTSSAGSRSSAK